MSDFRARRVVNAYFAAQLAEHADHLARRDGGEALAVLDAWERWLASGELAPATVAALRSWLADRVLDASGPDRAAKVAQRTAVLAWLAPRPAGTAPAKR